MSSASTFLDNLEASLTEATTDEEVMQVLFGAMAVDIEQAVAAEHKAQQDDALVIDADVAAFPMLPMPTIVRATRHVIALSGFSAEEFDDIFGEEPGTCAALANGDLANGDPSVYCSFDHRFTDFITISRSVALTFPGQPVRDWWESARHGKRMTPLDLAFAPSASANASSPLTRPSFTVTARWSLSYCRPWAARISPNSLLSSAEPS